MLKTSLLLARWEQFQLDSGAKNHCNTLNRFSGWSVNSNNITMSFYQIAQDKVSHDHMDDEIVAIHFDTGVYYSLRDSAIQLWKVMEQPVTVDALVSRFESISEADQKALIAFLDELVEEGLLNRLEEGSESPIATENWGSFTPPLMEKYTDMKELLLADPIHDVDADEGWPRLKPDQHG